MSKGLRLIGCLLDHDGRGHFGVDGTEVRIVTGLREGKRKLFIGIEHLGFEDTVRADDGVRDVVVIDPGDRGSWSYSQRGRAKTEIVDLYFDGGYLLRVRRKPRSGRQRCNQHQCRGRKT